LGVIAARFGGPSPEPFAWSGAFPVPTSSAVFFPPQAVTATSAITAAHVANRPIMFLALYLPQNARPRASIPGRQPTVPHTELRW
jgi:hypothetical protein